jgi:hypothetical protein
MDPVYEFCNGNIPVAVVEGISGMMTPENKNPQQACISYCPLPNA